ncbi:hypothetical protein ACDN41_12235 [Priestia aryabhattai]|uniref:hypothetical protein n=1 Tax=Priestia aryabhattai TaxID=412384 RepID=UPI0035327FA6
MPRRRKTHEEFVKEVYDAVGDEYSICEGERYVNTDAKIKMKHNKCGYVYDATRYNFVNKGYRCPKCSGKMRKTNEEFKKEVLELVGEEYQVLGEYVRAHHKIKIKHNSCNNEYLVTPDKFLQGGRCPKCALVIRGRKRARKHEDFLKIVYDLVGDEYSVIGEYGGAHVKVEMKHNICGNEYMVQANDFIYNRRCPKCQRPNYERDTDSFIREVKELVGDEYEVMEEYKGSHTKTRLKHTICNHEYMVTPSKFISAGRRCPKCASINNSYGTKAIEAYLKDNGINYKTEKTFKGCIFKKELPFDFYLNDYKILIEFDGVQHFTEIEYFGGSEGFVNRIRNDKIKNDFCINNDIALIRIPYWDQDDIDTILDSALGYFKITNKESHNETLVSKYLVNHNDWSYERYITESN